MSEGRVKLAELAPGETYYAVYTPTGVCCYKTRSRVEAERIVAKNPDGLEWREHHHLTEPQRRMLEQVREHGTHIYNGRARQTVEALATAGLVTYDYDQIPQSKGSGIEIVERFIVRLTEAVGR